MGGRHGKRVRAMTDEHPMSDPAKWQRIVQRGQPDYLDSQLMDQWPENVDTPAMITFANDTYRKEVQRVARSVFEEATTVEEQKAVVKDYINQFPHLAFDPNSWFWSVYRTAKARGVGAKEQLLTANELRQAVVNGINAEAPAWMTKRQFKAELIEQAHRYLEQLKRKRQWKQLFEVAGRRSTRSTVAKLAHDRLIKEIKAETGYESSVEELSEKGLSVVLALAAAKKHSTPVVKVSERDLH